MSPKQISISPSIEHILVMGWMPDEYIVLPPQVDRRKYVFSGFSGFSAEDFMGLISNYKNIINEVAAVPDQQEYQSIRQAFLEVYGDEDRFHEVVESHADERDIVLEPVNPNAPDSFSPITEESFGNIEDLASSIEIDRDDIVSAFDSSSHTPRGHGYPSFLLVNIGYAAYQYMGDRSDLGQTPYIILFTDVGVYPDTRRVEKEIEHRYFLENFFITYLEEVFEVDGGMIHLFFDESFNLAYTYALSIETRSSIASSYKELFEHLSQSGITLGGVFYSGASTLTKYLAEAGVIRRPIRDRMLMDRMLGQGGVSPIFRVRTEVLEDNGIELYTCFLKVSMGNVLRIEFPRHILEGEVDRYLKLIKLIYLDSLKGEGYPLTLSHAHHQAVLRFDTRIWIEEAMARAVGLEYSEVLSMKNVSKFKPLI